jgi:hypothetical protein
LLPPTDRLSGIHHTGEFSSPRRRAYDVPADAPPEHVKQKLRAEVEDSLRDVCGNWPTGEFDRIVSDVTATAIKYPGTERRKNRTSTHTLATRIPGAAVVMSVVTAATHSLQRFLQLETLPLG